MNSLKLTIPDSVTLISSTVLSLNEEMSVSCLLDLILRVFSSFISMVADFNKGYNPRSKEFTFTAFRTSVSSRAAVGRVKA